MKHTFTSTVVGCIFIIPMISQALPKTPDLIKPLKTTLSGNLSITGCPASPGFRVNNRSVPSRNIKLSRTSLGFKYTLKISRTFKRVQVQPHYPGSVCKGRWTPGSRIALIHAPGQTISGLNFNYKGTARELRIPVSLLAALIQAKFRGTQIRLNNYGRRHGNSWYKGNDSQVRLSSALGNGTRRFSIPAVNKIPYRYYISNVNLRSINVGQNGSRFKISLAFESSGVEIKGRCATGNILKRTLCAVGSDKAAPDVQMNNAVATVLLTPAISSDRSSITYSSISTDFNAKIQAQGVCKIAGLCNKIFSYKRKIKNGIKSAMFSMLNRNSVRSAVANALRGEIRQRGIRQISGIQIIGQNLVIWYIQ